MKSRSHRLPISDPHDDWVDGSWTVDCVCGVNFDDGEEMVNCDECGVWVHTRCSRYVKSEKLFACDKCKTKNSTRNDSEETEVAQLLVELPTKTLRMDNPYSASCPPRRPFRLWTDIPIEKRVHVQGIPGGDPSLFGGLSSVFGPQLWKSTGYVPKKFSFQYREFPCWDDKQDTDKKGGEEDESPVDKGADVLFSLSKDNAFPARMVGVRKQIDGGGCDRLVHSEENKNWGGMDLVLRHQHYEVKKDRSLLQTSVIHSSKNKKENLWTSKDQNGKKKAKFFDKEGDFRRRLAHASRTVVSTLSSDAKQLEFYEDKGPKAPIIDSQICNKENSKGTEPADLLSRDNNLVDNSICNPMSNPNSGEHPSNGSSDVAGRYYSIEAGLEEDEDVHQVPARIESSHKTEDSMASPLTSNGSGSFLIKEEVIPDDLDNSNDNEGGVARSMGINLPEFGTIVKDLRTPKHEAQEFQESQGDMLSHIKVKKGVENNSFGGATNIQPPPSTDMKLDGTKPLGKLAGLSADHLSEDVTVASSQPNNSEVQAVVSGAEVATDSQTDKADELPGTPCQLKQHSTVLECSLASWSCSPELPHNSMSVKDSSQSGGISLSSSAQHKVIISGGKSLSSSTNVISKPSNSDDCRSASVHSHNSGAKQKGMSDRGVSRKQDDVLADVVRYKDGHQRPKKIAKELSKSIVCSVSKSSHSSKLIHASVSKRSLPDSKDPLQPLSSKTSLARDIAPTRDTSESSSTLQTESALLAQNKVIGSGMPQKGEKINQSNCQLSSKLNHAPSIHSHAPSNSVATLSDEELALLLHQELNSSPRVPRVSRMRHAGSLPQLASPTAASMLTKRTSSSGGKDHSLVPRRKNKDSARDGSRSSRQLDDEAKKMDRMPLSPDQRKHDSACTADCITKKEADNESTKVMPVKRSMPAASTGTASSGPSSSTEANNEHKCSSTHNSPRIASDDDAGTVVRPTYRTLPGLIAEIMSKGERMTYEELCDAVLPHWPNLRKHNGERYAYSSHSQAVLDCLRNRNEWARLVDRGPKTTASRKRRKLDAVLPCFESEDNEYGKDKTVNNVESKSFESRPEEFPKGKRNARQRRRLDLQGRGVKGIRMRQKAEIVTDNDVDSFSNSSEESMFSEDEIQGGGACPVGSEDSANSDDTVTVM